MENEKKLQTLKTIAHEFNRAGIAWAVGGSLLLFFHNITEEFHDIDLMVLSEDAEAARAILLPMGTLEPSHPKPQFRSKAFLEFLIGGVEVDVMAGFAIVKNGVLYDRSLMQNEITEYRILDGETVPLHSLAAWRRNYELMGKPEKVRLIDGFMKARNAFEE